VRLPYRAEQVTAVVERRAQEGYISGWKRVDGQVLVRRRYQPDGRSVRSKVKRMSRPSRWLILTGEERWSRSDSMGTRLVQTTKGRMTGGEARKLGRGGVVWMWLS
jgi:small subunit ribosomal protein S8